MNVLHTWSELRWMCYVHEVIWSILRWMCYIHEVIWSILRWRCYIHEVIWSTLRWVCYIHEVIRSMWSDMINIEMIVLHTWSDMISFINNLKYFYICCLHHVFDWKPVMWFFSSQEGTRNLSLFRNIWNDCVPHYIYYSLGTGFRFLWVKWPGRESDRLSPSSKSKIHPTAGHEGPEGEQIYSSTLPSTSVLNGFGW